MTRQGDLSEDTAVFQCCFTEDKYLQLQAENINKTAIDILPFMR